MTGVQTCALPICIYYCFPVTIGPMGVSKGGLVLDATYDNAPKKAAVYAALEAKGIQCLDTI